MSLSTSLVDIDSIHSSQKRSSFSESSLEKLANLILQIGGIIKPLILKKIALENFEVIDGHFEYYAALKAQELDPNCEMIRAFIITEDQQDLIQQQSNLLNNNNSSTQDLALSNVSDFDQRCNNLESRLNDFVYKFQQQLNQNKTQLEVKVNELKEYNGEKLDPLNAFNDLSIQKLALALNTVGIKEKVIKSIDKERKQKPFNSLTELIERVKITQGKRQIKAISSEKMIKIIDKWSKISFRF